MGNALLSGTVKVKRAALSMLDLLMQQFREGLEASGVQGAEDWSYYAYAHENLPSVLAQGTHKLALLNLLNRGRQPASWN